MAEPAWPPFAVGDRVYTVVGTLEGRVLCEDLVDGRGEKQTRRWREPDETVRGHYSDREEAEAAVERLLGAGYRVAMMVPG
jgi:hypothetical protein